MRVNLCGGCKLCLFHGRYYLNKNFDRVLQDVSSYLATYPSETILMRLMVEAVNDGIDLFAGKQGSIDGFQQLVETTYIAQNHALWVQTNQFEGTGVSATHLTLGAVRDKIVLLWDSSTKTSRYGYDYGIVDTRGGWEFDSNDALMIECKRRAVAGSRIRRLGWSVTTNGTRGSTAGSRRFHTRSTWSPMRSSLMCCMSCATATRCKRVSCRWIFFHGMTSSRNSLTPPCTNSPSNLLQSLCYSQCRRRCSVSASLLSPQY